MAQQEADAETHAWAEFCAGFVQAKAEGPVTEGVEVSRTTQTREDRVAAIIPDRLPGAPDPEALVQNPDEGDFKFSCRKSALINRNARDARRKTLPRGREDGMQTLGRIADEMTINEIKFNKLLNHPDRQRLAVEVEAANAFLCDVIQAIREGRPPVSGPLSRVFAIDSPTVKSAEMPLVTIPERTIHFCGEFWALVAALRGVNEELWDVQEEINHVETVPADRLREVVIRSRDLNLRRNRYIYAIDEYVKRMIGGKT